VPESPDVTVAATLEAAAVKPSDPAGHDGATRGLDQIALLEHGSNLSGGQRQRVALARALHADREVLLLRDPTSAVDAVTEDEIAVGLRRVRRGRRRTIVVTTSPLLLGRCDRVLFLAADGSSALAPHADLMRDERYRAVVLR